MTIPEVLAYALNARLKRAQICRETLAARSGLSIRTVRRIMNGKSVNPSSMEKVCDALGTTELGLMREAVRLVEERERLLADLEE